MRMLNLDPLFVPKDPAVAKAEADQLLADLKAGAKVTRLERVEPPPPAAPVRIIVTHGTTAFFPDLPADAYHADPCEQPSLSSSIANTIDKKSPLHAHAYHPRFGGKTRERTEALDGGTLTHALLLGDEERIHVVDAKDFRTNAAKLERDTAIAQGLTPILIEDFEAAEETAKALRQRIADKGFELTGRSELTAFWTEESEHGIVQCRGRMDHVIEAGPVTTILDLKNCRSAHPDALKKHIDAYGYDLQQCAYVRAAEKIGNAYGRVRFVFIFMETETLDIVPVELDGEFCALGERRWKRAVETWARCTSTGVWPGYADGVLRVGPPGWAMARELEREAEESAA